MPRRTCVVTITDPTGHPREGLQIAFARDDGATVTALTDASGTCRAALSPGGYTLVLVDAAQLNGDATTYEAGTIWRLTVPDGAGPPALLMQGTIRDLARRVDDLAQRVAALESPLATGGQAAGDALVEQVVQKLVSVKQQRDIAKKEAD